MNRLTYKFKKRRKEKEYRQYIEEHLFNIEQAFVEMVMCPNMNWIPWEFYHVDLYEQRIQTHDASKYSPEEFDAYRAYFYPVDEEEKELYKEDFDRAWKHHYENNRHHWEARQHDSNVVKTGDAVISGLTKEQAFDCLENVIDWMAMGYKFGDRPYQFYEREKDKIKLPQVQRDFIEKVIYQGIDKEYIEKAAKGE